jgi:AcrR family transcriptional regulator
MMTLQLRLNENLYIKDPQSTELGRKIISSGIEMIDKMGFEGFTFKKLSIEIDSTEASIYRYFENKHRLLVYLIAWYWGWMEYRIAFEIHNISEPVEKLLIALKTISEKKSQDINFPEVDEPALHRIVISESDKTYLTKQVDEINKEGLFRGYKSLCKLISEIILEINPDYKYPHSLISTILEASNQQIFFTQHLPSLTDLKNEDDLFEENFKFLKYLVLKAIG